MNTLEVFDPPMCCSTGVCGPDVDPVMVKFAALLDRARSKGWAVNRFNLNQEPLAFLEQEKVKTLLEQKGVESLPVLFVNGELKSSGAYPSEQDLEMWLKETDQRV